MNSTEECCKLYNKREAKSGAIRLFASSYYPQRRELGFLGLWIRCWRRR
nr:MAG TPA: hypothetical protein [Caudoviricetes sp.]